MSKLTRRRGRHGRVSVLITAATLLVPAAGTALGANAVWQNVGSNWTTNGNWSAAFPQATGESATFNAVSAGSLVNPNLAADLIIGSLNINNTDADYSILQTGSHYLNLSTTANSIVITGGGSTTINPEIRIGGVKTLNTGSTDLNLAGGLGIFGGNFSAGLVNSVPITIAGTLTNRDTNTPRTIALTGSGSMNITANVVPGAGTSTIALDGPSTFTGTLRLAGSNTFTGNSTWRTGTLVLANNGAMGGQTILMGTSQSTNPVAILSEAGITHSNNIGFNGSQTNTAYTVGSNSTSGLTTFGGTFSFSGFTNAAGTQFTAGTGGTVAFTNNFSGGAAGTPNVNKVGGGTVVFSGTNTYGGTTKVSTGTLRFARALSLYNNTPGSWTATNITVNSGATLALNVGAVSGEFSSTNVAAIAGLGTAGGGFQSGATLALDTTSGNFAHTTALGNTNSNNNVVNFQKLGANTLTLTQANTYTGNTTVSAGTLSVTGSLANNGSNKVFIATDPTGAFGTSDDVALARTTGLNASYNGFGSTEVGGLGTVANLLMGKNSTNNSNGESVTMKWRTRAANETNGTQTYPPTDPISRGLVSDVVNLTGMANSGTSGSGTTDAFVLEMTYSDAGMVNEATNAAAGYIRLDWLDTAGTPQWKNAILGNDAVGSSTNGTTQNYAGTFTAFLAAHPGTTDANINLFLGSYGVDPTTNTVWAVLDHNSQFAVIPEPATIGLLGASSLGLLLKRRRKH